MLDIRVLIEDGARGRGKGAALGRGRRLFPVFISEKGSNCDMRSPFPRRPGFS